MGAECNTTTKRFNFIVSQYPYFIMIDINSTIKARRNVLKLFFFSLDPILAVI